MRLYFSSFFLSAPKSTGGKLWLSCSFEWVQEYPRLRGWGWGGGGMGNSWGAWCGILSPSQPRVSLKTQSSFCSHTLSQVLCRIQSLSLCRFSLVVSIPPAVNVLRYLFQVTKVLFSPLLSSLLVLPLNATFICVF